MIRVGSTILYVILVFIGLLAIHQWQVDNQARYALGEATLVILRILIGVQFAVGMKIISDAIKKQFSSLSVEWSFTAITFAMVLSLPWMALAAAFLKSTLMEAST